MFRQVPFHYRRASVLVLAASVIGLLSYLLYGDISGSTTKVTFSLLGFVIMAVLGLLLRLGYRWVKVLYLVCMTLTAAATALFFSQLLRKPMELLLAGLVQSILLVWALILLFFRKHNSRSLFYQQMWQ